MTLLPKPNFPLPHPTSLGEPQVDFGREEDEEEEEEERRDVKEEKKGLRMEEAHKVNPMQQIAQAAN